MNAAGKVDLHTHTSCSDGLFPPKMLIKKAAEQGLAAIAITDHESIKGLDEAQETGKEYGIEVVAGVEIGAGFLKREIHILGYYPQNYDLLNGALSEMRQERYQRMEKVIELLKDNKIDISWDDLYDELNKAAPGRLHVARAMQKKGYVNDVGEAFNRYLGWGKPAYIPRLKRSAEEIINLLKSVGAVPVLAHPSITSEKEDSIFVLKKMGIRGIEVFHSEHTPKQEAYYREIATNKQLLITGGSDFHGDIHSPAIAPGYVSVDYQLLAELKQEAGI